MFTLPSDYNSSHLYMLSSKFNWKPVFKSQINRAFLPTTPKRASRFFTAGLYLAYDYLVVLHFNFHIQHNLLIKYLKYLYGIFKLNSRLLLYQLIILLIIKYNIYLIQVIMILCMSL